MDAQIRTLYQNKVGMKATAYTGPVKKLADKFGMPRWKVSSRARELEVMPVQKKEPIWSDTELYILQQCAHRSPPVVQKYLKRAGYRRSQQGIRLKRKRLQLSRATMNGYTMRSLAGLFGVDEHVVKPWIKKGRLKAERRGTARTPQQGGDEWFIRPEWVREFMINNVAVIDFRKVDKYWLVEMLTKEKFETRNLKLERPEITEPMDFDDDPAEEYGVSSEVIDMFDEVQGII